MEVKVKHVKGMHFIGEGSSKVITNIDAATTSGGTGHGASPMEMVLMAMAGCSGMDIVSILEKMQVAFNKFEVSVIGERTTDHPRVFSDIELVYKFWGDNLPSAKIKRAIDLSIEKYCSVANMLDKVANVTYKLVLNSK